MVLVATQMLLVKLILEVVEVHRLELIMVKPVVQVAAETMAVVNLELVDKEPLEVLEVDMDFKELAAAAVVKAEAEVVLLELTLVLVVLVQQVQ